MKALYIAGPISGVRNYRERFAAAQRAAEALGWGVLNPAMLPPGKPWEWYMPICLMMVGQADAVVLLDGWQESRGAEREQAVARQLGLPIYKQDYIGGNIPPVIREPRE